MIKELQAKYKGYSKMSLIFEIAKIREDTIDEILDRIDTGVCELCEHASENHRCHKYCKKNDDYTDYERETFIKWLKEQNKNE